MKLFDDTTWIASAGKLEKLQPMILSAAQVSKTKNKKQKTIKQETKTSEKYLEYNMEKL